ncbi:hypothetical protein EGW08_020112, partial [Elysia chlorotica]
MDELEESVYNVPPSPHLRNIDDSPSQELPRAAPPTLMPKKGSSFRISFADLDRRVPGKLPTPAPRTQSIRKSSLEFLPAGNSPSLGAVDDADDAEVFQTHPFPQVTSRESPDLSSSNVVPTSNFDVRPKTDPSENVKNTKPRPVPRPRKSKPQEDTQGMQPVEESDLSNSHSEVETWKITDEGTVENKKCSNDQEVNNSNVPFSIPLDADSLELLFDKEVNDKYGFNNLSSSNSDASVSVSRENLPPEQHVSIKDDDSGGEDYCNINMKKDSTGKSKDGDTSSSPKAESVETFINLGTNLRSESSSDEPFSSTLSSSDPAWPTSFPDTDSKTTPQKTDLGFVDVSDLDPLWQKKLDNQARLSNLMEKNQIKEQSNESTLVYNTASELHKAKETNFNYSTADRQPKPHFVTKPLETQLISGSSGWEEPLLPPPPLPSVVKPSQPPPVPPRPSNSPTAYPQRPENLVTFFGGKQNESASEASKIFDELPTPVFSPMSDNVDPFKGSGFDEYCYHFNARAGEGITQQSSNASSTSHSLPTPPSPSTKPKPLVTVDVSEVASSSKGVDPSEDPDRISRFVPPPPGVHAAGSRSDQGYVVARVKRKFRGKDDDSDSDSVDEMSPSFRQNSVDDMPSSMDPRRSLHSMEPQSPKKNIREGLLNKQGGFNANKGWRKRWVVFDGSKLSYYDSNKSQVSKRIIPVSCINNVEIDVKGDSFKFKVSTTLKNRVFVFAAENRDDCTMWANVLMAAVVEHKNSIKPEQGDLPTKPDKEGFIRFANMKEYYVTITGQMLRYYQSLDDYQEGSPVHEIDMKLASVKDNESKKLRLQLWVHYGHFDLIFPSEQELQQWRLAMEVAIAEGLADDTVLTKVYENMSNQQCADCGADNPHWASINLGIVVCKSCAGIHRMFDFRITRIKSLRMDTRIWTPSLIELMVTIGNANANMFWAARLPPEEAIQTNEMMDKRRDFITKKYIEKRFADKHPLVNLKPALGEELLKAAREDNVLDTMRVLFSGADVMYRQDFGGPTAFEIVKEGRQRLVMEFLFQNGGDPQSLVENVQDEDRLREDVRLQGFLNKTGPLKKTFERRWCVIEHGALTYYLNEKTNMVKGSVDRKDMVMISSVDNDKMGYQFELSTTLRDNRTYTFSSDIKDDSAEWMGTIAKLMAPVAVMEHVGMIDIKFAGYAYMKELVNEWHQTFLVFSWRVLNFMNKDLKFDYLDLRKASSIRMQDASNGYQNRGPCFVISSTKWTVYLQASLPRDTDKMYQCLLEAITGSGTTLNDQVLTGDNVPVIVDRCITHVEVHGLKEKGVYRTAGQSSRVQAL